MTLRTLKSFYLPFERRYKLMDKTKQGKKIVTVKSYTKNIGGKRVKVNGHRRSTPN